MKACKIVLDPSKNWKAQGYWSNPEKSISRQGIGDWGKVESLDEILAQATSPNSGFSDPNLSPESIRYWQKAEEESKKLVQNLTDEQKGLLADLQAGKMFPLSKLEDEI